MDDKEFRGWLEKQEQPLCVLIATRAALRVFPLVRPNSPNSDLAFLTARAILTSGVAANSPTPDVNAAAADAAATAYTAAYAAARAAADAAATARAAADAAARAAAHSDSEINFETLTSTPIWHDPGMPEWLEDILDDPSEIFDAGPNWEFWRNWYQGFLDGKPLDWELQRRVALIPDEDWEKGPEHIAALIEEIQAEFNTQNAGENARHPDLEPDNVVSLFKNNHIISASNLRLEADIKQAIGQFHEETGLNEFPEMFEPLRALPSSLGKISAIVQVSQPNEDTERELREEIGRLNAKIVALEAELSKAKESGLSSEFKGQVGRSLGDWKLYAAIAGAVWLISGDQVGMKLRLENIQELRNDLFGSESPFPKLDQHFSNQKE